MSAAESKLVLIVDDDREVSATFAAALQAKGYRIATAPNAREGQKLVETLKPDVVITDMMMPTLGGFPLLEWLKEQPVRPPAIMVTANEGSIHERWAREICGVFDYLHKPVHPEVLIETVDRAIHGLDDGNPGGTVRKAPRKKM